MVKFRATLEPVPHGGCFVVVPEDVARRAGVKHRDRARGSVNGAAYRSALMKYSGVFHMGVHKATLAAAKAAKGDEVEVVIERDTKPLPTDRVPGDLAAALKKSKPAAAAFAKLAPSHRREHVAHVLEAKKPETRARRIQKTVETLASAGRPTRRAPS